jgi:predicted AAA+ superfamily ATPase
MKKTTDSKTIISRYLAAILSSELKQKMVFLGGPRQVGKTSLAQSLMTKSSIYMNWDDDQNKEDILSKKITTSADFIIFDEIHKYRNWRQFIKGLFDKNKNNLKIMVTGSARLDHFRKGGDSLVGRYLYYRLHPLSLAELDPSYMSHKLITARLLEFGGFPETYLKQDARILRQWQRDRISRLVKEDIRDLQNIKDLSLMELLVSALPHRIGSDLSIKNLAEDLQVSPNTITSWIEILENLYLFYRISPYGAERLKAVKKKQKIYSWDWTMVSDRGARIENFVASHLLKYCHFHEDYNGHKMELRYIKDVEDREVDFIVLKDGKPEFAVECKTGERQVSKSLLYYRTRLKLPKCYQVHFGEVDYGHEKNDVRVLPFWKFCQIEKMV